MRRIIDAKYNFFDLKKVMDEQFQHLNATECYGLLTFLRKFENLIDSTLGTWNITLVDLKFKDNKNPVCSQPHPVPKLHKVMFIKDPQRLVSLGVLEEVNDSGWGAPSFAQPKPKMNCFRLLTDFRNLNRKLKCKPYPIPKICEVLLKREGFKYATSLDLNMGYYHIGLRK